jgi:uncharacterized protein YbjT (DUF2867 family)
MIAITGGTGFIGSHLVRLVLDSGRRVRVLARRPGRGYDLARAGAELVRGDILDPRSLEQGFDGAEAVIHLVGIIVEKGANTFEAVHHRGTANVVAAARAAGVKRLVHMSALGTREAARSDYHRTKWRGEEAVRASGLDWTIHRPSLVYGEGPDFVSRFVSIIRWSPVLPVPGDGRNLLQPVWVGDVAACFLQSVAKPETVGRAYELGGPRPCTLDEVLDEVMAVLGKRRPRVHVPIRLLNPQLAVLEKVLPNPPATRDQLLMLLEDNVCDTGPMRRDFDVEMPSLRKGLERVLA